MPYKSSTIAPLMPYVFSSCIITVFLVSFRETGGTFCGAKYAIAEKKYCYLSRSQKRRRRTCVGPVSKLRFPSLSLYIELM